MNYTYKDLSLQHFTNLTPTLSEEVRAWRNHPSVSAYMYQQHPTTQEEHQNFIHSLSHDKTRRYWAVYRDNEGLGVVSLTRINLLHSFAFLGIYVAPTQQHKGTGSKILQALEHIAFDQYGLHSLRLEVLEENTRAISFYTKNHYKQEGLLHDYARIQGRFRNILLMGKIRASF